MVCLTHSVCLAVVSVHAAPRAARGFYRAVFELRQLRTQARDLIRTMLDSVFGAAQFVTRARDTFSMIASLVSLRILASDLAPD